MGETVLAVVEASRRVAPANTNLGIALLLAPLAKAALAGGPLRARLARDAARARRRRRARRVRGDPPRRRGRAGRAASSTTCARSRPSACARRWRSAAERDSVASEYVTDFALTFDTGVPALAAALGDGLAVRDAIVELHLRLLDRAPDTLIARKRGADAAARVSAGARDGARRRWRPHRRGAPGAAELRRLAARAGNGLNPGTTADLVTATLFVALVEGMLAPSHRVSHSS